MKILLLSFLGFIFFETASAQTDSIQHITKLEIPKKKSKVFSGRDSSLILNIDTLIMNDRSRLVFYGKKSVKMSVKHAIIGKKAFVFGTDGKNNGSDMDMTIRFDQLGNLVVSAAGLDANNGSKTFPNGNGGKVVLRYLEDGLVPQSLDKKDNHYLSFDTEAGGNSVNAQSDIRNILSQVNRGSARPLGQLPQGQVYSGSPGKDGSNELIGVNAF